MVNINVSIPGDIHRRVKIAAVTNDKTIKQYVIEVLDEELRRRER